MDKDKAYKVHQEWIEKCLESDRLTEWEENFITDIKKKLEKWGSLTPAQAEILERIYAEKTD